MYFWVAEVTVRQERCTYALDIEFAYSQDRKPGMSLDNGKLLPGEKPMQIIPTTGSWFGVFLEFFNLL